MFNKNYDLFAAIKQKKREKNQKKSREKNEENMFYCCRACDM